MKYRTFLLISLLAVGALLFAACQPASPTPQAPTQAPETTQATGSIQPTEAPSEAQPQSGGTLVLVEAAMVQFDPPFIADDNSFHVVAQIHSFLFRRSQGKVMPDLATSWEFEDGGKTVVFHLRSGVMFHDDNKVFPKGKSREVVASDVVYSIQRMVEIQGTQAAADLIENFVSVEAVDAYTVRLHLKNPDALLFAAARGLSAAAILPKEAVDQLGADWALNPIGSGPFKFESYKPDDSVTLVRNDAYRVKPYLDKIVYKIYPDENAALIALESGEVQQMLLPAAEFERFKDNPEFKLYAMFCPNSYNLEFSLNEPLFKHKGIREAITHAIDGRGINAAIWGGMAVEGCGTAGPGVPGYDPQLCDKYFSYDPAKSAALLSAAGWKKNAGGIWEKDGQPLKFSMELYNTDPMPKFGAAVLTQLKEAGMDVDLTTVEFGTWIEDYMSGKNKPAIFWNGFCGEGGLNGFWGRSGLAPKQGYNNEEVFKLLDEANILLDVQKREETLRTATDLIFKEYVDVPFGFSTAYEVTPAKVHNYEYVDWFQNITTDFNNVWIEP